MVTMTDDVDVDLIYEFIEFQGEAGTIHRVCGVTYYEDDKWVVLVTGSIELEGQEILSDQVRISKDSIEGRWNVIEWVETDRDGEMVREGVE
jgi:hypothetical protein